MQAAICNGPTRSLWLRSFGHIKIQAPGSSFYDCRLLWRHLCEQDTALCSRSGTEEWISWRAALKIDHGRSARFTRCPPFCILFCSIMYTLYMGRFVSGRSLFLSTRCVHFLWQQYGGIISLYSKHRCTYRRSTLFWVRYKLNTYSIMWVDICLARVEVRS